MRHVPSPAVAQDALRALPPDDRDEWLDLLWDTPELFDDDPDLPRGCVPYLPCPVTSIWAAIQQANVTSADVFVDVGAGLGRTAFLVHLLTGAGCIGVEIQPSLVKAATGRATWLNLSRTRFIQGNAVDMIPFIPIGTVFFLYCPFSGVYLQRFLDGLESIARTRQIRVCCVGMPALKRPWLTRLPSTSVELDIYQSTCCDHKGVSHPSSY